MSTAAPAGVQTTSESPRLRIPDLLAFAALAYIPFLLSSPGKVSGDTKQYLYLDPGRLLSRAVYLWDPHVGTGTVPHQNVGYLFPMGPYYWLMDQVGVPDWVAQRLWMGSISFAAAAGALWLFTLLGTRRSGAIAGAVVFMLTPYQVAFNARLSVLLLPFAGLPWLVGLTIRAAKRGGWRDPCLFALVVLLIGGTNASSLVLVGIAPVLWLVVASVQREIEPRVALGTAGRIALPTVGVSLWWAAGLVSQARYGIPVLDVTENLRQVAAVSRPADLLRGLGNWFLSGSDRLGPWLDQANAYRYDRLVTFATFAVPIAGLVAAAAVRWRHRAYFIALVVVGTIVGVGAWPYDDPSPIGSMFKTLIGRNGAAAALRNTPRVASADRPGDRRADRRGRGRAAPQEGARARFGRGGVRRGRGGVLARLASRVLVGADPARRGRPRVLARRRVDSRPGRRRDESIGAPGFVVRRVPVGQHRRSHHARADGPTVGRP